MPLLETLPSSNAMITAPVALALSLTTIASPAPAVGDLPSLKAEVVVTGLSDPVWLTTPPADASKLFVVEQGGRIQVIDDGALLPTPFLDIAGAVTYGGEEGLLGLAFHPDFAVNGHFYVYYNDAAGDAVLSRFTAIPPDAMTVDPLTEQPVLVVPQPETKHNGGTLGFGTDGMLYLSTGDGGGAGDPLGSGQSLATLRSKVLRIDVDSASPYAIPPDNPFVGLAGAREETWAYGLRNPWRGAIDPVTGAMFLGDVGGDQREEVLHIEGGGNYGWECLEGSLCTGNPTCVCPGPGFSDAAFEYDHNVGCAVVGGPVYRGAALPAFDGRVFFADFCVSKIWSFAWDGAAMSDLTEHSAELTTGGFGLISSFGQDADGEIYFLTIFPGAVYRVVPNEPVPDCDGDGAPDADEILAGTEFDVNGNAIPDSCELFLNLSNLNPGQDATAAFLGAQPGDPLVFAWTTRGIGAGPCFFGDAWCLSLLPMSAALPYGSFTAVADAEGKALLTIPIPVVGADLLIAMQTIVFLGADSLVSNPVQKVIPGS